MYESTSTQGRNRILAALPSDQYLRLRASLTPAELVRGLILYETGSSVKHVYFPVNALISLVIPVEGGSTVEVGLIGNDGMSGISAVLGDVTSTNRALVQIPGWAWRAPRAVIKEEFSREEALYDLLLRYMLSYMNQVERTTACNATHSVEERLARWLLVCMELVGSNKLRLTEEFIADMLGMGLANVMVVARALQSERLIEYDRDNIHILDQQGLEEYSCECYKW
jgi:CRP-like cAMP-binding protein